MGFRSPLVAARTEVAARLQRELGTDTEVIGADGDRLDVLQAALPEVPGPLVMIHDAERALTPAGTVRDVLGALTTGVDAVVPVQAMTDSVKEVTPDGLRNVDRATLAALQSPRLLRREALEAALRATPTPASTVPPPPPARAAGGRAGQRARDEILELLAQGSTVHTVAGSHSGFAVVDRLSLWQAQISLGLERDTSSRHRASLRP